MVPMALLFESKQKSSLFFISNSEIFSINHTDIFLSLILLRILNIYFYKLEIYIAKIYCILTHRGRLQNQKIIIQKFKIDIHSKCDAHHINLYEG